MLSREDNELLCRVEGDAPMGRLMRAHWIPACLSEEVAQRDGAPVRVRLLGEDLVAFRDSDGRLGIVDEHCPHRRASLALGRNEECGLRCLYHGWKIDVEGNVVDRPSEPREASAAKPVRHTAYPCREAGGFVWVMDGCRRRDARIRASRVGAVARHQDQRREDPRRLQLGAGARRRDRFGAQLEPAFDRHGARAGRRRRRDRQANGCGRRPTRRRGCRSQRTDFGFRYVAIRRPIADADTHDYLRITLFVAPFTVLIPPNDRYNLSILNIPLDDTNTMFYFIAWSEGEGIDQDAWRKFCAAQRRRRPRRRASGASARARTTTCRIATRCSAAATPASKASRTRTSRCGRRWVPIADRSRERLGASDIAIVQFRRIMVDAARTVAAGGPVIGTSPGHVPQVKLQSFEGIVPKND